MGRSKHLRLCDGEGARKGAPLAVIWQLCLAYLACTAAFSLLAVGAAAIPVGAVEENVRSSLSTLAREGQYPRLWSGGESWTVDNYTTAIMLNQATHDAGNPVLSAAYNFQWHGTDGGDNQIVALRDGLQRQMGSVDGAGWIAYGRYWHGYLAFLKPLLVYFDLRQIRLAISVAFVGLLAWSAMRLGRRGGAVAAVLYVCSFLAVHFPVAMASLSFAPTFLIAVGATVFVLSRRAGERGLLGGDARLPFWATFYFVIGAVTVYLDFLDTPIITLGVPLVVQLYLERDFVSRRDLPRALGAVLLVSACWGLGYGGLMVTKWVLSTLVTGHDFIADGLGTALYRSGETSTAGDITRAMAISKNVSFLGARRMVAAFVVLVVVAGAWLVRHAFHGAVPRASWWFLPLLLLVALYPYLWYLAAANHSYIHTFITYRDQVVTLVALGLAIGAAFYMPRLDGTDESADGADEAASPR